MQNPDGVYGDHDIAWFNGGLFQVIDIPPIEASDLAELHAAARDMDWRDIDPTIFGTLFERGLDPKTRAPLGAHYTDVETINKLIDPVVTQPLLQEWETTRQTISQWLEDAKAKVEKADAIGAASELSKKAADQVAKLKEKAKKLGIKYQTFIAEVLRSVAQS
jgi:predicted DNA binding CopG/RHH family protein